MLKKNYKEVEKKEAILADGSIAEGVKIRWLIDETIGAKNFAMRRVEVKPGLKVPLHNHKEEHEIYILSGNGRFSNDQGEIEMVNEGDFVYIPSNENHSVVNIGKENLYFLCLIPYLK
jgi:quercetin dioxygenase-like cupin family protein